MYEILSDLYRRRMEETKKIQLTIHQKIREADKEIRSLNKKIKESEEAASKDPMTKLMNRAALMKTASEFIDTALGENEKVGGIFIDIDFFKECNDTYGHARGDEIIKGVAEVCRKEESESMRFSRYGGDEFFGITHGLSDREIENMAVRICRKILQKNIPNEKNPNGQRLTVSVGLVNASITDRSNTIIDIANYADKALYQAKESGRNAIYFFEFENQDEDGTGSPYKKISF